MEQEWAATGLEETRAFYQSTMETIWKEATIATNANDESMDGSDSNSDGSVEEDFHDAVGPSNGGWTKELEDNFGPT